MKADWRIEFDAAAAKELKKLTASDRLRILKFLRDRVAGSDDPRGLGTALTGEFAGLWRYRVGDFRLIASIDDAVVTVLILRIGHRREIYR